MKKIMILVVLCVFLANLGAQEGWRFGYEGFGMAFPPDAYLFETAFGWSKGGHQLGFALGGGQAREPGLPISKSGVGEVQVFYGYKELRTTLATGKVPPRIDYIPYGLQAGVDHRLQYRVSDVLKLHNYAFIGEIAPDRKVEEGEAAWYDKLSAYGSLYSSYRTDISYSLSFSYIKEFETDEGGYDIQNEFLLEFFYKTLQVYTNIASMGRSADGALAKYSYDLADTVFGLERGQRQGDFMAAGKLRWRFFFLENLEVIVLNRLYIAAFAHGGYILPQGRFVEQGETSSAVGGELGVELFSAMDIGVQFGYNFNNGFDWSFYIQSLMLSW